jgi:hypothetical protein
MYDSPVKFSATGRYGNGLQDEDDVYTIEEFIDNCKCTAFTDFDGFGFPVKDNLADENIVITPSQLSRIPKDATHIVWYNR